MVLSVFSGLLLFVHVTGAEGLGRIGRVEA